MGCNCKKKDQFEVVTAGGSGRSVFASSSKDTAKAVSRKYPDSVVKDSAGNIVHEATPPAVTQTGGPDESVE